MCFGTNQAQEPQDQAQDLPDLARELPDTVGELPRLGPGAPDQARGLVKGTLVSLKLCFCQD